MKWLLLIVLLLVVLVAVALWRRTQMTSGTPAGADPASVASGQALVPPPMPPAAGVPPVFDPLVPVIPVDPVEPHEAVLGLDESAAAETRVGETPAAEPTEDLSAGDPGGHDASTDRVDPAPTTDER